MSDGATERRRGGQTRDFAANNGVKAIYAEKALSASLKEADDMAAALERECVIFNMGTNRRWDNGYDRMKAIIDSGERVANGLRKHLRMTNVIATVCPLLGLLGTVLGMIKAFNAIVSAGAMGQPALLAGGIGQALITTAAGLSVAGA